MGVKGFGYINLTRAMLVRMKPRGKGVIVNVVGMAGVTHPPSEVHQLTPRLWKPLSAANPLRSDLYGLNSNKGT